MTGLKNPLNDDQYDGNDEQIDDLKDAVRALKDTIGELTKASQHLVSSLTLDVVRRDFQISNSKSRLILAARTSAEVAARYPD